MSEVMRKQDVSPDVQLPQPFNLHGNRMVVVDDDYRMRRESVSRCLSLLPEYAASLAVAGHQEEANRLKCLAYDMAIFWQEEDGPRLGMKAPDEFLSDLEAAVSDAGKKGKRQVPDIQAQEAIREGFRAHIAEMSDDAASLCLHLNTQYTELIRQMGRELGVTTENSALDAPEKVSRCLRLIPSHAASLSTGGREAEAGRWKCLAYNMALFWQDRIKETPDEFLNRFEKTVKEAKATGQHPNLSGQEQEVIRAGIQSHIGDILGNPDAAATRLREQYSDLIEITRSLRKQGEQAVGENPAVSKDQNLEEIYSRMSHGFDLMCAYAMQCAVAGQDIGELRKYSLAYADYWGVRYYDPKYKNNVKQHFNRLVNVALFLRNAPQLGRDEIAAIVSRFRDYEHDMRLSPDKSDEHRAWISEVHRFANRLEQLNRSETRESSPAVQSQKTEHLRKKRQPER